MSTSERRGAPCRYLRTKLFAIDPHEVGRRALEASIATEHYWCVFTMGPAGPDDSPAEPEGCDSHRACYREMKPSQPLVPKR